MKILKVALIVTLVAILGLGIGLPVLATSEDEPQVKCLPRYRVLRGTVDNINDDFFTIQPGEKRIGVDEDTRFFRVSIPQKLTALYRNRVTQTIDENPTQLRAAVQLTPRLQSMVRTPTTRNSQATIKPRLTLTETEEIAPNIISDNASNVRYNPLARKLKRLRQFAEEVEFGDLAIDDKVVVLAVPDNGELLAKVVLIMTPTPYQRLISTVDKINESQKIIEVNPKSDPDEKITFTYDDRTTFLLRGSPSLTKGDNVLIIYIKNNDNLLARKVIELP